MSEESLQRRLIWKAAFTHRGDGLDNERSELETTLLLFRRRVIPLLNLVARDMPGYTVHDIDHVDAIWEMAEIIAGPGYELNPAEAFVFGCATLLHDAGMTLAAYPGGLPEIQKTDIWKDNCLAARRLLSIAPNVNEEILIERKDFRDLALTATLRDLHSEAAAKLLDKKWPSPDAADVEFLLERSDFRRFFGEVISQIAASHHWDGGQIVPQLGVPLNAFPSHDNSWAVDKVKLALLLRCSDAAHIDGRRAPRLLFALNKPVGISAEHWLFQSKIAKPREVEGKLQYTSSSSFEVEEIEAWQLAWDTIKMIDQELGFADEIMRQRRMSKFVVNGVDGAKLPQMLAEFIQVRGWTPILPDIKVSDVAHLARTLGGHDLYSSEYTPLRELIQNAADAIEARIAVDERFSINDGKIIVRVKQDLDDLVKVIVEDNGIGMSERVLTGPLIDFGKSFWQSALARTEYPGLQGKFREPRGRYGIGFFSIFMWANEVLVASRPFESSRSDTRILEFHNGLGRRPILREIKKGEGMGDIITRVSLLVPSKKIKAAFTETFQTKSMDIDYHRFILRQRHSDVKTKDWRQLVSLLSGLLTIKVYLELEDQLEIVNLHNWQTVDGASFVGFFGQPPFQHPTILNSEEAEYRLSSISEDGKIIGRAFLTRGADQKGALAIYEKGIFVDFDNCGIVGAIEGRSIKANRERSTRPSPLSDHKWVLDQEKNIFFEIHNIGQILCAQTALINIDRFDVCQPAFVFNREILSLKNAVDKIIISRKVELVFLEEHREEGKFAWNIPEKLSVITGDLVSECRLNPLIKFGNCIIDEKSSISDLIQSESRAFTLVMKNIINALGDQPIVEKNIKYVSDYDRRRFLYIMLKSQETQVIL